MKNIISAWLLLGSLLASCQPSRTLDDKPNVIFILTDDQGIGDLSCHGNPWLKTPNIDDFYEQSVRITDFHVSPVCTPTRAALMTGQYPINNGTWATYKGRDALHESSVTMAEIFKENGYRTGIFGKWHLGDNYPVRATDKGFDVAVQHMSGGVGELSDYWGNNYFDDTYFVNNEPKQFRGYCTDVWFTEAMRFIEESKDKPFFAYIPTNAPHSPFYIDEKYAAPYRSLAGKEINNPEFYGMITNIDENFGLLEAFLKSKNLADNTILIYMTDNGTSDGISRDGKIGYNHGFRGRKSGRLEGSHRVPFFIRWQNGKIKGGRDIKEVTAHIDLLPTLASLCKLVLPTALKLDGVDISPLILNEEERLEKRTIFVHNSQDWRPPRDVNPSCIIKDKWRLVHGNELYDLDEDRMQVNNLASEHPDIVNQMLQENEEFVTVAKGKKEYQEFPVYVIGHENQKVINLTIQHAIGEAGGFWKSEQVAGGLTNKNNKHALRIERDGIYRISCARWPRECPGPILGIPSYNPKDWFDYKSISPEKVRISISNQIMEKPIGIDDEEIYFDVNLERGKTFLINDFIEGNKNYGVYYTYIEYIAENLNQINNP